MIVIWSGYGFLTIVIVALTTVAVGGIGQALLKAIGRPDLTYLAISLGILAAAAANWFIGKQMNSTPPRELVDVKTNQRVIFRRLHKLFWIRMEYWSVPVAVLGLVPLLALFGR